MERVALWVGATVTCDSAGVADGDGRRSSARSHDSVRGHDRGESLQGRGYHSSGTPANRTDGRAHPGTMVPGWPACLQQTRRDRQVAGEIGERAIPTDEHGELVEPEARPESRHDRPIGLAADPDGEGAARLDGRGQVPEDGPEQDLVADRDRADAPRFACVPVTDGSAVRAAVEPAMSGFAAEEAVIGRMGSTEQL